MRQEGVLFLLFMFIILTNVVVSYLILSSFSVKRSWKYLCLLGLSVLLSSIFLVAGIDSVVLFFNNMFFKTIATVAITLLLCIHVLKPWLQISSTEDKQVAVIFRGLIVTLVLLTVQAVIFSLGMIVHEGNNLCLSQD